MQFVVFESLLLRQKQESRNHLRLRVFFIYQWFQAFFIHLILQMENAAFRLKKVLSYAKC